MILRKAATGGGGAAPGGGIGQPSVRGHASAQGRSWIVLFFLSFLLVLFLIGRAASSIPVNHAPPNTSANSGLRTPLPTVKETEPENLDNCGLINRLLKNEIPSTSNGLPQAGKPTSFGAVFWLKTPVLRATLPENNADVVLLKYNKYLPKQHTLKWSNTVSILQKHGSSGIFPKMYAFCKDPGDGFHYILVEWINLHPSELKKPTNFEQCFERASRFVDMLVKLDEDMQLTFMDVKKGQWMARQDEMSFVLQDVDDIVNAPWTPTGVSGELYVDQVEYAQGIVQQVMGARTAIGRVRQLWNEEFFPNGYTIRYTMVLLRDILLYDMGFSWERHCADGMPSKFMACLNKALDWASSPATNWPAPRQFLWAMNQCKEHGTFDKSDAKAQRPPAKWRDASKKLSGSHPSYISCFRSRDQSNVEKTDASNTEWCYIDENGQSIAERPGEALNDKNRPMRTCCRAKGSTPCYYYVRNQSLCK